MLLLLAAVAATAAGSTSPSIESTADGTIVLTVQEGMSVYVRTVDAAGNEVSKMRS